MPSNPRERPIEQPAVRTTIVGGRPPGAGKGVGDIPRGVEVLVKKASVDPEFKAALLARRADVAKDIGLALDPAEVMMLNAVPAAQLEGIIARTTVSPGKKSAFLGRAAAVMLAALGTGIGCDEERNIPTTGVRSDRPKVEKSVATTAASEKATTQTPAAPKASTEMSALKSGPPVVMFGLIAAPREDQGAPKPKASTQIPAQKAPLPAGIAGILPARPDDAAPPKGDVKATTSAPAAKGTPPEIQRSVRGARPLRDD